MDKHRTAYEAANRPAPVMVGAAVAIILVLAVASSRCSAPSTTSNSEGSEAAPTTNSTSPAVARLDSLDAMRARLLKLNPSVSPSKVVWSPVIHDGDGAYRGMWFGHASTLRADVDGNGLVKRLSLHTPRFEDRDRARRLAAMIIEVAAPDAPATLREADADALGAMMSRDLTIIPPASSVTVGDVLMTLNVGALDLDLSASPTA